VSDRNNSPNLSLAPCWQLIGETNGVADWECRECKKRVSRGSYPTHLGHKNECSYSAWPIIERAEKAEAALGSVHETPAPQLVQGISRALETEIRPVETATEPKPCEHVRSELLAEKHAAGEPLFQMRKCLDCTLIFRVRSSLKST
jgi:hypothetical protein